MSILKHAYAPIAQVAEPVYFTESFVDAGVTYYKGFLAYIPSAQIVTATVTGGRSVVTQGLPASTAQVLVDVPTGVVIARENTTLAFTYTGYKPSKFGSRYAISLPGIPPSSYAAVTHGGMCGQYTITAQDAPVANASGTISSGSVSYSWVLPSGTKSVAGEFASVLKVGAELTVAGSWQYACGVQVVLEWL